MTAGATGQFSLTPNGEASAAAFGENLLGSESQIELEQAWFIVRTAPFLGYESLTDQKDSDAAVPAAAYHLPEVNRRQN